MSTRLLLLLAFALALAACGPGRTSYARYPGAPATIDRTASNPQALEIADAVLAAAGGAAAWDKARQIRWRQTKVENGNPTLNGETAWDRWNQRHYARVETPQGAAIVAYAVYGEFSTSYTESKNGKKQLIEGREKIQAIEIMRANLIQDVTVMLMPFLMLEPGNKLDYVGLVKDGETEYHEIKVTFGDGDKLRTGLVYHAIVDKTTNVVRRVDISKPATNEKIGFELSDWTEAGGVKLPATRKNLGSGELNQSKDFKVGEVDDELYMTPLINS